MRANIKISPLEKDLILAHVLKKSREYVLTHPEHKLTKNQSARRALLVSRRLKGEPLAYILGHKEFYGLNFIVNENVLVPRPETELIIDHVTHNIKHETSINTAIVDVGTGSGCIIITLAEILNTKYQIPNTKFIATDISAAALSVAKKNARLHGLDKQIKFFRGNLLGPILKSLPCRQAGKILNLKSKIIITANLPYGWKAWKNNCSQDSIGLKFEPPVALYTGKNGLQLYEKLLKQIAILASNYKKDITCFFEFDPRQTVMLKKLIKKYLPDSRAEIKKDLRGHSRLLIISFRQPA